LMIANPFELIPLKGVTLMPQGDFTGFSSTVFGVAFTFIGGYLLYVGWSVPRLMLTFKARHWLEHQVNAAATATLKDSSKQPSSVLKVNVEKLLHSWMWISPEEDWLFDVFFPIAVFHDPLIVKQRFLELGWLIPMIDKDWWDHVTNPAQDNYWPEMFLLGLLFIGLGLVLTEKTPALSSSLKLLPLTLPKLETLKAEVFFQPVANLFGLWVSSRRAMLARTRVEVNVWTTRVVQTLTSSIPLVLPPAVLRRLKITSDTLLLL